MSLLLIAGPLFCCFFCFLLFFRICCHLIDEWSWIYYIVNKNLQSVVFFQKQFSNIKLRGKWPPHPHFFSSAKTFSDPPRYFAPANRGVARNLLWGQKRGSGERKSPIGVQRQSPGWCLETKPQKPETCWIFDWTKYIKTQHSKNSILWKNFQLRRGHATMSPPPWLHHCPQIVCRRNSADLVSQAGESAVTNFARSNLWLLLFADAVVADSIIDVVVASSRRLLNSISTRFCCWGE